MKRNLIIILIFLGFLFRIWASQPTWLHGDENYYINIFQNFVDHGKLTPYMWRLGSDTNIIAGSGTGYGIFVIIGWMSLFGESLFSLRMLMVIAGLISIWILYLTSKRWWESKEAGLATAIFGIVSTSAIYTLVGRMDAIAILSYSLLLLLHIVAIRKGHHWIHFFVGAMAILSTEFHIIGIQYVGAFAFYYGYQLIKQTISEKKFIMKSSPVYFFTGAGIFGVLYIIVHIVPDPEAYFLISSTCAICFKNIFLNEYLRTLHIFGLRPFEFILIFFVLFTEIKSKNSHLLLLISGFFITQTIIGTPPYIQYFHHFLPLLSIGVGGAIHKLLNNPQFTKYNHIRYFFIGLSFLALSTNLVYQFSDRLPFENAYPMPDTYEIHYIKKNIPQTTVVLSTARDFYPLKEYRNFLDYTDQIKYGINLRRETLADFLERMDPQVIYLSEPPFEFKTLEQFIQKRDFVTITPNLWISQELLPED